MIYYDTETIGLVGTIMLVQYAEDDGPIILYDVWDHTADETIALFEWFMSEKLVGFNLAFDHFHVMKMYNCLKGLKDKSVPLHTVVDEYHAIECTNPSSYCLKPVECVDLFLHARKGPYQSTMDRSDVRIKRVPSILAQPLCDEMNKLVPMKDVYFARKSDPKKRFEVCQNPGAEFVDIKLAFAPSSAMKALAVDTGVTDYGRAVFKDIALPEHLTPKQLGYIPYGGWLGVFKYHYDHWTKNMAARSYATLDIDDTRKLYRYFAALEAGIEMADAVIYARSDRPTEYHLVTDDDSMLATCVAACRWKGYALDIPMIEKLRDKAVKKSESELDYNSSKTCLRYLTEVMDDTSKLVLESDGKPSTKGVVLETISKWTKPTVCMKCNGMGCPACGDTGLVGSDTPHPAAIRAREILDLRHAKKEIELYDKLLAAKRLHASFKVIGALSGRMSGSDGLNPQGIKRDKTVRTAFPLSDPEYQLIGGDFAGSQVAIADAVYGDPVLHQKLLTGLKIHALFGMHLFPTMTYDEIVASSKLPEEQNKYARSKNGVFAMLFGGEAYTLMNRVGVSEEAANKAYQSWVTEHKVWGQERKKYFDMFCSMRQPNGLGTRVEWHEPSDYVESIFGFRRYFTLENKICKALFTLAETPPKEWERFKIKVVRRDRVQTACGAVRSALFAAAFAIQAGNMRAAANHVIQSPEASFVKRLQRRLWDIQPAGIHRWLIQPMNIHDEIMAPADRSIIPQANQIVKDFITEHRKIIELLDIDWKDDLKTWADK